MNIDTRVSIWLIEYKSMLEREARSTNIPIIAKRNMERIKEIENYLLKGVE